MHDHVAWKVRWRVDKSDGPTIFGEGNILLTAGVTRVFGLLTGVPLTPLTIGSGRIGVGDGTLPVASGQTSLAGVNRWFSPLSGAPVVVGDTMTVTASFGPYDGNFPWDEWGIDFGAAGGVTEVAPLLNRKVAAIGTKAAGATWQFTIEVTLA